MPQQPILDPPPLTSTKPIHCSVIPCDHLPDTHPGVRVAQGEVEAALEDLMQITGDSLAGPDRARTAYVVDEPAIAGLHHPPAVDEPPARVALLQEVRELLVEPADLRQRAATKDRVRPDRVHDQIRHGCRERQRGIRPVGPGARVAVAGDERVTREQRGAVEVEDRPARRGHLPILERRNDVVEPPRVRHRVVVDERDELSGREPDPEVS